MDRDSQEPGLRRISLMVRPDQYKDLTAQGLNVSGLIRDLIDDYLSAHKITVSVDKETRKLYDQIVANTGSTDVDVEIYFKAALKNLLKDKIEAMQELQRQIGEIQA